MQKDGKGNMVEKKKLTKRQVASALRLVAKYWDSRGFGEWLYPRDVAKQCRQIARNLEHGAPL